MHNTTIKIESLEDVYNFRTKVFEVVNKLSDQEIYPSRIASAISSFVGKQLKHNKSCEVETSFQLANRKGTLEFRIPEVKGTSNFLDLFFDKVQNVGDAKLLAKSFLLPNHSQELTEEIFKILNQKSKEELAREVREKNIELQQSLEDLKKTTMEKTRMANELNVAKEIQLSMLPLEFPAFTHRSDIDVFANLIPAREVGGDFYDFFFLDDVYMGLTVGDVSGKGVPAALMMAVCKTLLKSRASTDRSTASILTHVNNEMAKDNKNYMFITVFMAVLNTRTGELVYTNAGHNPTYIRKNDGSLVKLTELHGPVVAAMEGMTYGESKITLDPGDTIFAYTDGIPEAHNANDELFSDDRLSDFLANSEYINPENTVKNIIAATKEFEGEQEQFDDITALCLEYKGSDMMIEYRDINILNHIDEVQTAMVQFEEFAEQHQVPLPMIMKVNIVLDEIISNIIKYGFPEGKKSNVYVRIELQGKKMNLIIEDEGVPFNPFQKTPPDLSKSIDEREIGGLGIHLVRQLMDEFEYNRSVNKNVVTMSKHEIF